MEEKTVKTVKDSIKKKGKIALNTRKNNVGGKADDDTGCVLDPNNYLVVSDIAMKSRLNTIRKSVWYESSRSR